MLAVTTRSIEGQPITRYIGLVSGETVASFPASGMLKALNGGRKRGEENLQTAFENAVNQMCERAELLGADAVISVEMHYTCMQGTLICTATGTAVTL